MKMQKAAGSALRLSIAAGTLLFVTACADLPVPLSETLQTPEGPPAITLDPVPFDELETWDSEDFASVLPTLLRSCEKIKAKNPESDMGTDERMGTVADWISICEDASHIRPGNMIESKYFFESRFVAYRVGNNHEPKGLFTGYYEPELEGRWAPEAEFQIPLYSRPTDIVSIDLGKYRPEMAGTQLAGRLVGDEMLPYYSRAEINVGSLKGRELEIVWVADPAEAFFLHIQGSGRIRLPDGSFIRVGYAGRNGHRYTSIGRELVAMGQMRLEDVTAPAIMDWLRAYPAAGSQLMNRNESYVFFRVIEGDGPIGAQNVVLTPGRSLAVDPKFVPYGVPLWLDTTDPLNDDEPLRRLMVAQDTGSAIKGPVRGDVFWGFGPTAARRAGLMKQAGRYYMLLPKAAERIPLS